MELNLLNVGNQVRFNYYDVSSFALLSEVLYKIKSVVFVETNNATKKSKNAFTINE